MPEVQVSVAETSQFHLSRLAFHTVFRLRRSGVLLSLPGGSMSLQMVLQELGIGWCDSVAETASVNVQRDVIDLRRRLDRVPLQ